MARSTKRSLAGAAAVAKKVMSRKSRTAPDAKAGSDGPKKTAPKTATKAAPAQKATAKKSAARKSAPEGAAATKAPAKAAPAKKSGAKKAAPKVAAKKAPAKAAPAKDAAAKKAVAKKAPVKKAPAKKAPAKAAPAEKAAAKKTASAKKTAPAKKTAAKQAATKKTATKKAAAASSTKETPVKSSVPVPKASKKAAKKAATKKATKKAAPSSLAVREDESKWTKAELNEVLTELNDHADRLRQELLEQEEELAGLMKDAGDGAGHDQADMGATSFERDQELIVVNNARDMLAQIERALERIDDGTYGVCESCGNPIGKMRLMAFPRATLCMSCKQREERR
ncbi:TraR/DksA C4-type zinc finger protein [Nocardioides sp. JQ2195]|uniref:TraR/DksA family transcriptional regulator n=1 Tax=Nocardioides sp. JQ2195 TaxID=2592334 RepID=UPI003211F21F